MRKFAEELIIQTKTFLRAVLFVLIFILPWIYHFCGPRKIAAACLGSGYHLATNNALFISGGKHRVTAVALQKDAQGVICLYSGQLLLSQSFSHSKATSPWFTLAQTSASAVLPNGLANAVCPRLWSLFYSDSILFRLSGLFYYYINPLLLPLLLLLLLFQKSWPMVFVLWN